MKNFSVVNFSIAWPRSVVAGVVIITLAFLTQFPKIKTDTNPKNMLPDTSDVRVWNNQVEKIFRLYEDMIVLGITNDKGILNPNTLTKIERITNAILMIKGVAARDVSSFTTIDNVTSDAEMLRVGPLMTEAPKNKEEIGALRKKLFDGSLFINRIISNDAKTTAIYIPLEKGANGKEIADKLREILAKDQGDEEYDIVGDPVTRDTFGEEMFKLMGIFSPIAGIIMFVVLYLMFRSIFLAVSMMMVAMVSIIWSMGLLMGLHYPVHIMSSMSPVFLMAIATDSIHIFNEFFFRYGEIKDKKAAILATMETVGRPVRYTALATATGFGVLMFMHIIPVKVFGGVLVFGTLALRLLSFSFIPALLTFLKEEKINNAVMEKDSGQNLAARILRGFGSIGVNIPKTTVFSILILVMIAIFGATQLVVNNNMVGWFKESSEIRMADGKMNAALGGTSTAYIVALSEEDSYIKQPETMRYLDNLQRHLDSLPVVGKTLSVVDYVKKINKVLHNNDPEYDKVPDTADTVGQYMFLFSMSAKPADLDNVVDYPFKKANIWVQLKTWDAAAMRQVIEEVEEYKKAHPTPILFKPAGVAYFNLVWNNEVLWDMVKGFIIAVIAVFVILVFNFHSYQWALVGYIPLLFTILLIYGFLGFIGKDFDMPVSVLSCLSLGMAVDFAIHFISRFKQRMAEQNPDPATYDLKSITESLLWTIERPGKGIMRNAILFATAFSVMLFAPLTPYITVGAFIMSMMTLSALMTIIYLPALILLLKNRLFK